MAGITVFRRTGKNGSRLFYVQYRNPTTGLRGTALSINKLFWALGGSRCEVVHTKAVAWEVAYKAFQAGIVSQGKDMGKKKSETPFAEYVSKFWDFETSDYIKRRNKEKPNSITKGTADKEKKLFERYAVPLLPKGIKLSQVKGSDMEQIRDSLFSLDISNSTINQVLQSLRSPLKEAYRLGYIKQNIGEQIRNATPTPKETGILSSEEIAKIFAHLQKTEKPNTYDRMFFLAFALALSTGMREGEIRGLKVSDISIKGDTAHIYVSRSFSDTDGYKVTKGKRARTTVTDASLGNEILDFAEKNPWGNGYCFWSTDNKDKPIGGRFFLDHFKEALNAIGISEEERKTRNLKFHSLRGNYATAISSKATETTIKQVVGHSSILTTERYYLHEDENELERLNRARREIIPIPYSPNEGERNEQGR